MLLFKDAKQGQTIYLLNRETAEYTTGTILSTPTFPHYEPGHPTMVVDVKIKVGEKELTYSIPENLSVTYGGDWCIATDQHDLLTELDAIEAASDKAIADYDRHKERKQKCASLRPVLNPELKEKQQTEERLTRIETGMENLSTMFQQFLQTQINKHDTLL